MTERSRHLLKIARAATLPVGRYFRALRSALKAFVPSINRLVSQKCRST